MSWQRGVLHVMAGMPDRQCVRWRYRVPCAECGVWSVEYGGIALRALSAVKVSGALCAACGAVNSLDCMHQQAARCIE